MEKSPFGFFGAVLRPIITPADRKQGDHIWRCGVWRNDDYVVYSGYSFPGYRWTGAGSLEIDVKPESNGSASIWCFKPVLKTGVLVSLVFGGESVGNRHPIEPIKKEPNQ